MESIVAILQERQREADLALVDAERVGVSRPAKVGPDLDGRPDAAMLALAHEQERQEAAALMARQPVDHVERYVDVAARNLVAAAEVVARIRLDLGQVSKDLVTVARQALAVDKALVRLADEKARAARASDAG